MIYLQREPPPKFWTRKRVKQWTQQWLSKGCVSSKWAWPQYRGKKINRYAGKAMEIWHHNKCAFCEAPLLAQYEIEHFRSKAKHPLAAFIWRNLFLICRTCNQSKGSENHEGCLKPDRDPPADYLWINPTSLKVEPRPGVSGEARQRAVNTIKRYRLNRPELKKLYERYLLRQVTHSHLFPLAGSVAQAQNTQAAGQPQMHLAALQALAQPEQPFSLMVKSLLEYHNAIGTAGSSQKHSSN